MSTRCQTRRQRSRTAMYDVIVKTNRPHLRYRHLLARHEDRRHRHNQLGHSRRLSMPLEVYFSEGYHQNRRDTNDSTGREEGSQKAAICKPSTFSADCLHLEQVRQRLPCHSGVLGSHQAMHDTEVTTTAQTIVLRQRMTPKYGWQQLLVESFRV